MKGKLGIVMSPLMISKVADSSIMRDDRSENQLLPLHLPLALSCDIPIKMARVDKVSPLLPYNTHENAMIIINKKNSCLHGKTQIHTFLMRNIPSFDVWLRQMRAIFPMVHFQMAMTNYYFRDIAHTAGRGASYFKDIYRCGDEIEKLPFKKL